MNAFKLKPNFLSGTNRYNLNTSKERDIRSASKKTNESFETYREEMGDGRGRDEKDGYGGRDCNTDVLAERLAERLVEREEETRNLDPQAFSWHFCCHLHVSLSLPLHLHAWKLVEREEGVRPQRWSPAKA